MDFYKMIDLYGQWIWPPLTIATDSSDLLVYILVNSDELMNQGFQWESLLPNDTFLIVASSDGAFEKMTMHDVCDLMLYVKLGVKQELGSFAVTQQNLADYVVDLFL
uniref:Uncharacterized protein n=1 Tax=Oryza glumipatula TaxID=40148 RepID=A0A0E0BC80_9ORYZ